MQVAISTVFGPLKDHPSKATPRAGATTCSASSRCATSRTTPGVVELDGRAAVAVAAVALRPLLQRPAQPRRRAARRRDPARRRADRLRRRHRAVRRDLARGARPDRGRDGDLRDGRDPRQPPVRSARRVRRGRSRPPQATDGDGRVRGPTPCASTPRSGPATPGEKVLHVSPWMAKGIDGPRRRRRRRAARRGVRRDRRGGEGPQLLPPLAADRHGHLGQLALLHSVSGMAPEHARCMHRTTIEGDYGLGRFEASAAAAG